MPTAIIEELAEDEEELIARYEQEFEENVVEDEPELDVPLDYGKWIDDIVLKCMLFLEALCDVKLYPYQYESGYRCIESILLNDGETISLEQARQSGKSEVLANVIATMMVLCPRLAKAFPDQFGHFAKGWLVGVFAPTDEQADTVWGRVVDRLSSEVATEMLLDPEIDDKLTKEGAVKSKAIKLKSCGSLCRRQTCNPKAKVESKTYHFILIDECQDADAFMIEKSIEPMLASTNGTMVFTGTPARHKGKFYKTIQRNRRHDVKRGVRRNHFCYDYKFVCKYNPRYRAFIAKKKFELGEDSDEFQLSYACKWILDQGMFVTEEKFERLADKGMKTYKTWYKPGYKGVVVGIDPARTKDSTVVTVIWVDWDRPDAFGFLEHRVLNWLEINNQEWEKQYYLIAEFLSGYKIARIGVDSTGMGSAVYDRIRVLFPEVDVVECPSDTKTQGERWRHFKSLIEREAFVYPAHSSVRRTRSYRRFIQQMTDLETKYQGKHMLAEAPEENDAHDDYADSACIACSLTTMDSEEEAESIDSPWARRR